MGAWVARGTSVGEAWVPLRRHDDVQKGRYREGERRGARPPHPDARYRAGAAGAKLARPRYLPAAAGAATRQAAPQGRFVVLALRVERGGVVQARLELTVPPDRDALEPFCFARGGLGLRNPYLYDRNEHGFTALPALTHIS